MRYALIILLVIAGGCVKPDYVSPYKSEPCIGGEIVKVSGAELVEVLFCNKPVTDRPITSYKVSERRGNEINPLHIFGNVTEIRPSECIALKVNSSYRKLQGTDIEIRYEEADSNIECVIKERVI